jgi:uncharacterized NAD(P)/FAD-binding protein YdhS
VVTVNIHLRAPAYCMGDGTSSNEISVCIVGLGSRGLTVLERIATLAGRVEHAARRVRVEIVDPVASGVGLHAVNQPDYLLLNTICSQLSMFPEAASVGPDTEQKGPSLYAWVQQRGLRLADDGFTLGETGREVHPNDFLPRRILGEYLAWFLERTLERVPRTVSVRIHRAVALSLKANPQGSKAITLSNGTVVNADYLFLTTGHTPNIPPHSEFPGAKRIIRDPYPLPERLEHVRPGESVAVAGFGLTAMDVITSLTVGRGGRFVTTGRHKRYVPSGCEPRLLLYSRSGLPYRARPLVDPSAQPYEPLVFTQDGVNRLRESCGDDGLLDFRQDVLPLLQTEMRIAFHRRHATLDAGKQAERRIIEEIRQAVTNGVLEQIFRQLDERHGVFDPMRELFPQANRLFADTLDYQSWFISLVTADLREAAKGLMGSPLKAALELFRDLRDVIRHAVDFSGLTAQSHSEFISLFVPLMNRVVIGPQKERNEELLALITAGVLATPFGPAPSVSWDDRIERWLLTSTRLKAFHVETVDWICYANIDQSDVERSANPLIADLYRQGRIRRHRAEIRQVRGVDISPDLHPINAFGRQDKRMWVLGPLCEGPTFYNHYIPSPRGCSRALANAHHCVTAMFSAAQEYQGSHS